MLFICSSRLSLHIDGLSFLDVEISCLNPNQKDGGRQIYGNGELFIVFGYGCVSGTFPSAIRTILVILVWC